MGRKNPKGSREFAAMNLTDGSEVPMIMEQGQPIVPDHESRHMDIVRDIIDDWEPEEDMRLLLAYYYEGLSYRDLGRRFVMGKDTAYRKLERILAEFRDKLEAAGVQPDKVE